MQSPEHHLWPWRFIVAIAPERRCSGYAIDNLTPRKCLGYQTPLEAFLGTAINLGVALEM
jgi:hypothetical protein